MKLHLYPTVISGAIMMLISSCNQPVPTNTINKTDRPNTIENVDTSKATQANSFDGAKIKMNIYQNVDKGWGYDVLIDDKRYVNQPYIPAIPGNRSFRSKEDAEKTAALVMYKLKNNIVPPSLSIEELDSIGVLK